MATPHNRAEKGDFAKTVLMPGDPLRAKFIAEQYLEDARLVTDIRNMYGYTGTYKGKPVSVMAGGMGAPSTGIYTYELYSMYDVDSIIRIGTAGAYIADLKVFDLILAESTWGESTYAQVQGGCMEDTLYPDKELNETIIKAAQKLQVPLRVDKIHSTDVFYIYKEQGMPDNSLYYTEHGCVCCDMESFALFHNANMLGKKAACLLTISDNGVTGEVATTQQRQQSLTNMIRVALETVCL